MKPTPISYNNTSLQSTDYQAHWVETNPLQGNVTATFVQRSGAWPFLAGKTFGENQITIGIICLHDFTTLFENLNKLFDVQDETPRQLIVRDDNNATSDNEYYVYALPVSPIANDGPEYIVTLALESPIWESVTEFSQTFSTTSSTDSEVLTVGGNCETYPKFQILPGSSLVGGYAYSEYLQVLQTSTDEYATPLPLRLSLDTATPIGAGKMQADCDDLRIFRDGIEIFRWLDSTSINTTDTGIWINGNLPPLRTSTIVDGISSTDPLPVVKIIHNTAFSRMPNSAGRFIIDNEEFYYCRRGYATGNGQVAYTYDCFDANATPNSGRALRNTSPASHAAGATVTQIPYDFTVIYGNSSVGAPVQDDTLKPIIDLTSTNSEFKWISGFYDSLGKRLGCFQPIVGYVSNPALTRSGIYTSTDDIQNVDPAVAMGTKIATYDQSGTWRADSALIEWQYPAFGIDYITGIVGERYQTDDQWPNCFLQIVNVGTGWVTLYQFPTGTTDTYGVWQSFALSSSDLATIPATTRGFQIRHGGTIALGADRSAKLAITAITIGLKYPPAITARAAVGSYYIDFKLTNDAGEYLTARGTIEASKTLYIDTDPDYPTCIYGGVLTNGIVSLNTTRARWLALQPGIANIFYDTNQASGTDITIVVTWRNRMNFL